MLQRLKALFRKKPPVELQHPEFGRLEYERGLWSGHADHSGRRLWFAIGGTEAGPSDILLDRFRNVLGEFDQHERAALSFLTTQHPDIDTGDLRFYSMDFLWADRPDDFALEFTPPDEVVVWRVEFEDGIAKYVACDD